MLYAATLVIINYLSSCLDYYSLSPASAQQDGFQLAYQHEYPLVLNMSEVFESVYPQYKTFINWNFFKHKPIFTCINLI